MCFLLGFFWGGEFTCINIVVKAVCQLPHVPKKIDSRVSSNYRLVGGFNPLETY